MVSSSFYSLSRYFLFTQEVGKAGGLFRRNYGSTHGRGLVDALIGATAQLYRATLVTFNGRHYPMISDVQVPYARL